MTVKFKVGFTITGETLFAMIAKMLPIEDLDVEEVAPSKTPQADRAIELHQKKFLPRKKMTRASAGPTLNRGINMIIVNELEKGPRREVDIRPKLKAAGFSANSTSSRLESLRKFGVVERAGVGIWRLKAKENV